MKTKAIFLGSLALACIAPSLALAAGPGPVRGVFRPSWTPTGDFQLALELAGSEADAFVPAAGALLAQLAPHVSAPAFLGEALAVAVRPADATVVFPTAASKARLGRAGVIACVDAWYGALSEREKVTLGGIMASNPWVPPTAVRDLATSAETFVRARSADCGSAAPTRLSEPLLVGVPRYVDLKDANSSLGYLAPLDSVLGTSYAVAKSELERKVTAAALEAARIWAAEVRTFGFTTAAPALAQVVSAPVGGASSAAAANAKSRASVVLDVLRASTSVEVAKASLASGDYRPLRPSLRLADTLIGACTDTKGRWDAVACTAVRLAADFRWLRDRTDSPWYPSVRLFRQPNRGNWPSTIAAVAAALPGMLAGR